MKILIDNPPSSLGIEGILRTEGGTTYNGSHQSAIPFIHLAQIFHQIAEFVALYINLELLEVRKLCRQFTLIVGTFTISTSDPVPISEWKFINQFAVSRLHCLLSACTFYPHIDVRSGSKLD